MILTYINYNDDGAASTIVRVHTHRFAHWFSHLLPNVAEWQRRRAVMQEMAMITDSELSDIGLSRADMARFSIRLRRHARAAETTLLTDGSGAFLFLVADEICNVFRPFAPIELPQD